MKKILFLPVVVLIFSGCLSSDEDKCKEEGGKWIVKSKMNFLTGKKEPKGECRK
jgi:hypothetical protein